MNKVERHENDQNGEESMKSSTFCPVLAHAAYIVVIRAVFLIFFSNNFVTDLHTDQPMEL